MIKFKVTAHTAEGVKEYETEAVHSCDAHADAIDRFGACSFIVVKEIAK